MRLRLRRWWASRPLRWRITLAVGAVALVTLLLLSRLGAGLLTGALIGAADDELRQQADAAVVQLVAGEAPSQLRAPGLRVVDTAGDPVDGGAALPLDAGQVRQLAAGQPLIVGEFRELRRVLAEPAVAPTGTTRLVVVTGDVVGGATLIARAAAAFVLAAVLVAVVVAAAAWAATRAALRPVDRMRVAAARLPPGERLPVPVARDEVRALAEEINLLLARRDEAVARLERFTGDAAHELRSPVASIRVQAEVAVAHPDPDRADETLRAVADEAARLTTLLADLLALARADAGQRVAARPVDLVAAVREAVGRTGDGPAMQVVAPTPVTVAATPSEVGLVLDNLLGNAGRYARSLVRVAVLPAGRWVRLVVEDDGPGIPAADRERVFDRFTRLDPEAGAGAGLGLALVAALVRGRGGTVVAGTTSGGGARLEVRWRAAGPGPDGRPTSS